MPIVPEPAPRPQTGPATHGRAGGPPPGLWIPTASPLARLGQRQEPFGPAEQAVYRVARPLRGVRATNWPPQCQQFTARPAYSSRT